MSTTTIETPADKPEITAPDPRLLLACDHIQRHERHLAALKAFLAVHHPSLGGLCWDVWVGVSRAELNIHPRLSGDVGAEEIARRFPGEWRCGVPHFYDTSVLDWLAEREGVTIRIERVEQVIPSPATPVVTTFWHRPEQSTLTHL